MRRKLRYFARHTVTEAHADAEQKVALLDGHVGTVRAVHARKAQIPLLVSRDGPKAQQRCRARHAEAAHDVAHGI